MDKQVTEHPDWFDDFLEIYNRPEKLSIRQAFNVFHANAPAHHKTITYLQVYSQLEKLTKSEAS